MVTLSLAAIILFALHPRQKVEAITCSDSLLTGVYGGYSWGTCPGGHLCNSVASWSFDGVGNYKNQIDTMTSGSFGSSTSNDTYNVFAAQPQGPVGYFTAFPVNRMPTSSK